MSTTVKTGWLKDKNGDKFAPKTLTSQVQTSDGVLLEDKIQADIDRVADKIVQSDWNADEDEAGHVLNRTHWSETVYGEVLPLTKFKALYALGDTNVALLPVAKFEVGKTYTVVYDDVTYVCEAKAVKSGNTTNVGIGNDRFFGGEQTTEPFAVGYDVTANMTGIIPLTDAESVHSVQIMGEKTVYHKIPREYLYSKRIEFTLGGEDVPGYWNAYTNTDIRDIINDAENGVFQYATITFPMDVDERTADLHLTMPLASHETFTRDDGITVHRVQFECEIELDKRYVFVTSIEAYPEAGLIISGLTKKVADSIKVDTAEIGQTIVVKSVDENGKPTEWKAADVIKPDWNAGEDEAGHVLNRTHYKDLKTGDLFPTQEINIDELGAGTHLIFESSNNAHFTKTFAYDTVKYRRANTKGASAVGFELGGIIYVDKGVEKTATIGNLDYYTDQLELIDSKNYKFKCVGLFTKSQIFVVVDVKTLTAEYQALFPKVGVYIQIPENDSSYGMTNRRYLFQVYFYKHMSAVYMPLESARTADVIPTPSSAEVGQTIVVKSVDADGKPTEWEAVDYQERTHWNEIVEGDILPITEFTSVYNESMGINMAQLPLCELEVGKTYTVIFDDVTYTCVAKTGEMNGMAYVGVGNDMFFGGEQTSEPFGVAYVESNSITGVIPLVEGTHTVRIIGEIPVTHKIPREYLYSNTIDFEWGGQDSGSWMVYCKSNLDITIQDIVKEVKSGVMYYARITAPASITGLDYDLPLVMPSIAYNDAMPYGTNTGYSVSFECTAVNKQFSLDLMYIPGVAEAGLISFKTLANTDTAVVNPTSASVGQTIVVDEVDANGKPTKWKAADYQERTHWVVKGSTPIIAEQEFTFNSSAQSSLSEALNIVDGETYVVVWDGVEYICECKSGTYESYPILYIGNEVVLGKEDDGIPFIFGRVDVSGGISLVACLEPNSTHTAALYPSVVNKIPHRYLPKGIGDSRSVVLLPETTLTFTNSQYQGAHNILIEPGKTYKVLWNGTEYILTASYFNLGTMAGNGLGNQAAIGGTDTGEPFMLGTNVEGTALLCIELTGATSATVSIIGEEITMIPPKYLPDGIGYEIIENVLPATSATYVDEGVDKYFYVKLGPELIIDQNYLVNLNGTVYNCTAYALDGNDIPILGNANLMGVEDYNTGEPFCLGALPAIGLTYIYMEDPIPSFLTVSITSVDRHRIPTKYLPDLVDKDAILAEAKAYADNHNTSTAAHSDIRELITDHTHDGAYDTKGSAEAALVEAKAYADNLKVLPIVTASDNGAFLRVVDGVWVAAQLPNIEEGEF